MTGTPFEEAEERVDFQLSYRRSPERRRFLPGMLTGSNLDNSYTPGGTSPGHWTYDPDISGGAGDDDWFRIMFRVAVEESVHESLEWFKIDGKPALDPHRCHTEAEIFRLCAEFADRLYALRSQ